jgi:hypothetical protein
MRARKRAGLISLRIAARKALSSTLRELRAEVSALREIIKSGGGNGIVRSEAMPRRTIDIN